MFAKSDVLLLQALGPDVRFLKPTQSINVWLELVVPEGHGPRSADVFQVAAELAAADGRLAASISRPCLIHYTSPIIRVVRSASYSSSISACPIRP
jgi:hypothetical protein